MERYEHLPFKSLKDFFKMPLPKIGAYSFHPLFILNTLYPHLSSKKAFSTYTRTRIEQALQSFTSNFLNKCQYILQNSDSTAKITYYARNLSLLTKTLKEFKEMNSKDVTRKTPLLPQFSNYLIEQFVDIAYNLFAEEKIRDAANAFFLLSILNPKQVDYWLSLGICEQKQGAFDDALEAFKVATLMNVQKDPIILFHQAQCYARLNKIEESTKYSLEALDLLTNTDPLKKEIEVFLQYQIKAIDLI